MSHEMDFQQFCQELEALRGRIPLIRANRDLTDRILQAVRPLQSAPKPPVHRNTTPWISAALLLMGALCWRSWWRAY